MPRRTISARSMDFTPSLPLLLDPVLEAAEPLDLDLDPVAGLQELVAPGSDARGRAGEDDVAGMQRGEARQVRDLLGGGEDHLARVRVLLHYAVHPKADGEALRIGDLRGGRDPRTERAAPFEALVRGPVEMEWIAGGQRAAPAKIARGEIVGDRIARDMVERPLDGHVARGLADHRDQLGFPIELLRAARTRDAGARPDHAGARRLDEKPGLQSERARILRRRQILRPSHLRDVVGVVRARAVDRPGIEQRRVELHFPDRHTPGKGLGYRWQLKKL